MGGVSIAEATASGQSGDGKVFFPRKQPELLRSTTAGGVSLC